MADGDDKALGVGQALLLASSLTTPPRRLGELAWHEDGEVRRRAASNPSSPFETLAALAAEFPVEVARNPLLPLLALENTAMIAGFPTASARRLLSVVEGDWLLPFAADHPEVSVRAAVASHPRASQALLERLAADTAARVRKAAASNPRLPPAVLAELVHDTDNSVVRAAAAHPSLPRVTLAALLAGESQRYYALANPHAPASALAEAAADTKLESRLAAAVHRNLPPEACRPLVSGPWLVREALGSNPSVPEDVLRELGYDAVALVRAAVAGNPSTPVDVLAQLAGDGEWLVRAAVAGNPSTPASVLTRLVSDPAGKVSGPAGELLARQTSSGSGG